MEEKIKILWECKTSLWECKKKQVDINTLQSWLWKNVDTLLAEVKWKENMYWRDMKNKIKTITNLNK